MDPQSMVHKANQIALFFASYPWEEGVPAVADHLQKFWEPRMRRQLLDYVAGGGAGLHELVLAAAATLPEPPVPSRVRSRG